MRCTRVTARVRPGGEVGRWVAGLPRAAWSPTWSSLGVLGRCSPRGCGLQGLLGSPGLTGGLCPRGPGTCRVHAAVCKCKHQHHSAFRELSLWPQVNGVFPRAGRGELCPLASAWDSQDGWSGGLSGWTARMDREGWTLQEAGAWVLRAHRTFWLAAGLSLCALTVRLQAAVAGMVLIPSAASEAPQH